MTHLIKTEVPVKPAAPGNDITDEKPISEVEMRQEAPKHREARAANPCHPNPCFNGGVCVESEGRASCRCVLAGLDIQNIFASVNTQFWGGIFWPVMTSQNMHSHLMSLRLMVIVSTWRFRCEGQYLSHVYASMELEPGIN